MSQAAPDVTEDVIARYSGVAQFWLLAMGGVGLAVALLATFAMDGDVVGWRVLLVLMLIALLVFSGLFVPGALQRSGQPKIWIEDRRLLQAAGRPIEIDRITRVAFMRRSIAAFLAVEEVLALYAFVTVTAGGRDYDIPAGQLDGDAKKVAERLHAALTARGVDLPPVQRRA